MTSQMGSGGRRRGVQKLSKSEVLRMKSPIVENVRTSSDILLHTSRGLQLPYREKSKKSSFPLSWSYRSGARGRSEGLDPNGICYPCVMGWGLAGTGNSSAVAVAVPPPSKKSVFLGETASFAKGSNMRDLGAILPPFSSYGRCGSFYGL